MSKKRQKRFNARQRRKRIKSQTTNHPMPGGDINLDDVKSRLIELRDNKQLSEAEVSEFAILGERITVTEIVSEGKTKAKALEIIYNLYQHSGNTINSVIELDPRKPDCGAGCHWCCLQIVEATPVEALAIADYLKETQTTDEYQQIRRAVRSVAKSRKKLTDLQWLSLINSPCVFLSDGLCTVYEARPFFCRTMFSYDAEGCKFQAMTDAKAVKIMIKLNTAHPAKKNLAIETIKSDLYFGYKQGCIDNDLEFRSMDLVEAMDIAMDIENGLERWINGEQLFEKAKYRDSFKAGDKINQPL